MNRKAKEFNWEKLVAAQQARALAGDQKAAQWLADNTTDKDAPSADVVPPRKYVYEVVQGRHVEGNAVEDLSAEECRQVAGALRLLRKLPLFNDRWFVAQVLELCEKRAGLDGAQTDG